MEDTVLTYREFVSVARYTVQKIRNYPARMGIKMDYFCLLFPDELRDYLTRRDINRWMKAEAGE